MRNKTDKATTRNAKGISACRGKNLSREKTETLVLAALSERVFTPKRVSLMLNELLRHQRQAKTAEDARLITLTKELERATSGLDRLYQAVEEGALSRPMRRCAHVRKSSRRAAAKY